MKYVSLNGVLGIYKANAAGFLNPRNPNRTVKRPDDRRRKTFACQESFGRPHQLFYSSYYVFCRMSLIVIIHLGICNTLIDPLKDRGDGLRGFNVCEQRDVQGPRHHGWSLEGSRRWSYRVRCVSAFPKNIYYGCIYIIVLGTQTCHVFSYLGSTSGMEDDTRSLSASPDGPSPGIPQREARAALGRQ